MEPALRVNLRLEDRPHGVGDGLEEIQRNAGCIGFRLEAVHGGNVVSPVVAAACGKQAVVVGHINGQYHRGAVDPCQVVVSLGYDQDYLPHFGRNRYTARIDGIEQCIG